MSLAHLRDVFAYLAAIDVSFYRLASDLAPFGTHPDLPHFHDQLDQCNNELASVGKLAREQGLRLTFHAPLHVQLASLDAVVVQRSRLELELLTALLDRMGLDEDCVIVVHVGGIGGSVEGALARWTAAFEALPDPVRRRLVLEHEDDGASLGVALRIHAASSVPLVFDYLHFCLNNPEHWDVAEGLAVALATWPHNRIPKMHFSSQRTELRAVERPDPGHGRLHWTLAPPRPGHHADFLNPWEFGSFVQAAAGVRDFDVMLEAKASDLALLRLRCDLKRYVPEVAAWMPAPARRWDVPE
ncbi:MAG TPA: hypothetical protein VK993_15600 [Chthoniobacterales bacterium]|nr:hypothetical protein [Chthoniobacterales bacterium]